MKRWRRALLYMPGDSPRKINRGANSGVDGMVMDLEDGVASKQRAVARETIRSALQELDFGRSEAFVRVNPVGHVDHEADLRGVLCDRLDGIVLPKVESVEQLQATHERLALHETMAGLPRDSLAVFAIIETALGLVRLAEIAAFAAQLQRMQGLIFGALDYIASLGGHTTKQGHESFVARSTVVMHAKAHGLEAIDTVYPAFRDREGLLQDTQTGIEMGYTGKQIIHPDQVQPVQDAHSPTAEQLDRARSIVRAHREQEQLGVGAFALDGEMIDMPVIKEALALLERARFGKS
ncbi:MAG: CoA ester lyase [Anaerolineaceae bacterium]|nr:CoA ester lyase [Anaerolineaceae bacterium]